MKPCPEYRERLVWLALDHGPLEPSPPARGPGSEEQSLRDHVEHCQACRGYLRELTEVADRLATHAGKDKQLPASERFHQDVLRALRAAPCESRWPAFAQQHWPGGRVVWCAAGFAAALVLALTYWSTPPNLTVKPLAHHNQPVPLQAEALPEPSAAEYWLVAGRSLDQVDDLLNRQARRNLPPAPALNLSTLLRGE